MERIRLNTTVIYVLAGLGLLCCCVGGLGVIPAAIAFFIANSQLAKANDHPEDYENIKAMNTAKIVALVIAAICLVYLIISIYQIYTIGWDNMMEQSRQMMEEWGFEDPNME